MKGKILKMRGLLELDGNLGPTIMNGLTTFSFSLRL